jgi:TetR/AcrR family transcriptional repressor of nem operon
MRRSQAETAETHVEIVAQAARLFRGRGIDGTSVGDVMKAANRTHGGFYRHFETKEALLDAALAAAFDGMFDKVEKGLAAVDAEGAIGGFLNSYLSADMVAHAETGCPVPALAGDMARMNEGQRAAFGTGIRGIIARLADAIGGERSDAERQAARTFAMAVGAVLMARASDPETAAAILAACRQP